MNGKLPSLKWLNTFRSVAHCGSLKRAAEQNRQSISTVSQQLQCLEAHLGVALLDHSCRPMVVTTQGAVYLRFAEQVLGLVEQAHSEVTAHTTSTLRHLRFAMIEDFESDIAPEITHILAGALPNCRLTHFTRVSREILDLLQNRQVDIGIATQPQSPLPDVSEYPLLRDPFVLAVPANSTATSEDCIEDRSGLPFLRYSSSQIMGSMIEAQLSRLRIPLESSFELDSTSSIMALIARNGGWAITTPCNFARAARFHGQVRLLPFPRKGFARTISMFVAGQHLNDVAQLISATLRSRISARTIVPTVDQYPWLTDGFHLTSE